MKTMSTLAVILLLSASAFAKQFPANKFSASSFSVTQSVAVFDILHVHRNGDFATLDWIANVEGVSAFAIERSYDGEYFDQIDAVTPDASHWNKYTDTTVEPGIIYYRVVAWMDDGSIEYSTTESVKIVKHK